MTPDNLKPFGAKPLFNYVKINPLRVVDVQAKAKKFRESKKILKLKPDEQKEWAISFVASDKLVKQQSNLKYNYFAHLKMDKIPVRKLPSKKHIKEAEEFPGLSVMNDKDYVSDYENTLLSLTAFKILNDNYKAHSVGKIFSFIDYFPRLLQTQKRQVYPPVIFNPPKKENVTALEESSAKQKLEDTPVISPKKEIEELDDMANNVMVLWQIRQAYMEEAQKAFDEGSKKILKRNMNMRRPVITSLKKGSDDKKRKLTKKEKEKLTAYNKKRKELFRQKKDELVTIKKKFDNAIMNAKLSNLLNLDSDLLKNYYPGLNAGMIKGLQDKLKDWLDKNKFPLGKFCEVYEKIVTKKDKIANYSIATDTTGCFLENPTMSFTETVRLLKGRANLIKVEEQFIKYTPGEISYIENILAGEVRKRKVKQTNYLEQTREVITEETTDTSNETSSTTRQELSNQVESEINTRLSSDINSSINASGGGSLGVVDIEGAAGVDVGVSAGLDTSLSTSSSSDFSQEIISKAVEKVKKSTIERRLTRSYSLSETLNLHKIDNTGSDSKNGFYCFLDKHICITEKVYGTRLYLLANVLIPGRNLLCEKKLKIDTSLNDLGERPLFDITHADITPANYKELAGRFKASGINPPPAPIIRLGKTYKTDNTNASAEPTELKIKNIAETISPFFEQYKRYLILDNIRLPEGYEVREVLVTINHGSNGISVPAHIPLKLMGATICATPLLMASIGFPPYLAVAAWQVAFMASPFLHYNTDSSNVTVCIGNESKDSAYYFFEAEFLIRELFETMGNFSVMGPSMIENIKDLAKTMIEDLTANAANVPNEVKKAVEESITRISAILNNIISGDLSAAATNLGVLLNPINSITSFSNLMKDFFEPIDTFIKDVLDLFSNELQDALADLFEFLEARFQNHQVLPFFTAAGSRGELPVSFNTVSIKPGITINLTACLQRTEEALDQWRLETFNNLYQGYLQFLAEYERKAFVSINADRLTKSPGTMRNEERLAIKEIVLHALNNVDGTNSNNNYSLEKMNLFENSIDWKNMAYKLYNYGPNMNEVMFEKLGIYIGADERRKAFLKALWAQVLIPLQPSEPLEKQLGHYMDTGTFDIESEFTDEALTALYRDLILERELLNEQPNIIRSDAVVIPTDLIMLTDTLPENDNTLCSA